ncbi:MAG: Spermidine N(1)-acetyltransferase [Promethearchaeota archaeon]|nr:MAG: Spermidine N(1)-acetyltransferase [Candidatus Lokiarchaeota archaeon]
MSISPNKLNHKITPFLDGDHICLVPIKKEHLDLYVKWMNNPRVRRLARSTTPTTKEDIEKRFEVQKKKIKDSFYFEIFHKQDKKLIGDCGFNNISWIDRRGNIGLGIGEPKYWNKGIASEAVNLLLKYGFDELNLFKIYADIFSPNIGSWRCAEKVGMKREAELKKHEYIEGKYVDRYIYSIFKDDWKDYNKNRKNYAG